MGKRNYSVLMPFTGYVSVSVVADDEEGAIEAADEAIGSNDFDFNDAIVEMQYHRQVTRGNVCYAVLNEAEADDEGPAEDSE